MTFRKMESKTLGKSSSCREFQPDLSAYFDRALDWKRHAEVREHLNACAECANQVEQWGSVRQLLRDEARVAPPRDLAMRIRLQAVRESKPAISQWREALGRIAVRLENFLGPIAIPAASGVVVTVLIFSAFIYNFPAHLNTAGDVPLAIQTPARLRMVPAINFTTSEDGLMIMTQVDPQGRVIDFRVLNGTGDPKEVSAVRQLMVFTQFDPATRFGVPTTSHAIINLQGIRLQG
jgi:hypothetical protein